MGIDSDNRYHPQESEEMQKPQWVSFHRDMFARESAGYDIFPEVLGGRMRLETTFNQPVSSLFQNKKTIAFRELNQRGISTVFDALKLSDVESSSFSRVVQIRKSLQEYLNRLAVLPHARLLGDIFGEPQTPVNPEREQEIIDVVTSGLSKLSNSRLCKVLEVRYGLMDGITHTLEETAKAVSNDPNNPLCRDRARQLEAKALRCLRHPSRSKDLKKFLTLPEKSFARQVLGFIFQKDIQRDLDKIGILDIELSDSVREELAWLGYLDGPPLHLDMLAERANVDRLSPQAIEELKELFQSLTPERIGELKKEKEQRQRLARELSDNLEGEYDDFDEDEEEDDGYEDHDEFDEEEEGGETDSNEVTEETVWLHDATDVFVAPLVNNLLPEINLTEDQLNKLAGMQIRELNLPVVTFNCLKRNGIRNLGEVFDLFKKDLPRIRNFGVINARKLGETIEGVLDLPEDKHPKGLIPLLLISSYQPNQRERAKRSESFRSDEQRRAQREQSQQRKREERDLEAHKEARSIIESAIKDGCGSITEIKQWMAKKGVTVFGEKYPNGLKTHMILFYILSTDIELRNTDMENRTSLDLR